MNALEHRYRRILRLLPAGYRAEREEEMVSAFLDGAGPAADDATARPRWPEIVSVAALALRIRLDGSGAWGRTVRLTALIGLAFQATMSCVYLAQTLNVHGLLPLPFPTGEPPIGEPASAERLWHLAGDLSSLLWIVGYVALVRARPRVAKTAATLGLIGYALSPADTPESLVLVVATLALLAGYHRDVPAHRQPRWPAALPLVAGAALFLIVSTATWAMTTSNHSPQWPGPWVWAWSWLPPSGLFCLALLVAGAGYVVAHRAVPRWRSASVPLALAILTVPVALARLSYLNPGSDQVTDTLNAVTVAQALALVLCGTILAVLGARMSPTRDAPAAVIGAAE
ncbi:hypothetical protein [Herbidospora yilanensis]|uniref:hypothetical protein n=1 Tax=Herbidospora yilanensis TaxID=354426 RepID=UPI0007845AD0|nr:hypothetical protein [Herbidospora yilanensis]